MLPPVTPPPSCSSTPSIKGAACWVLEIVAPVRIPSRNIAIQLQSSAVVFDSYILRHSLHSSFFTVIVSVPS